MSYKICPNCNKKLDGLLTTRYILKDTTIAFINENSDLSKEAYCNDCGPALLNEYSSKIESEKKALIKEMKGQLHIIPILTINNPINWDYDPIGIISSQSVTGTGLLSEISSSWSDFLGGQSDSLSNKILNGENLCKDKLRFNALLLGGNAIIATDIDYSEVGGGKGMLMVCMAGTAVKVKSWSENFSETKEMIEKLSDKANQLIELNKIKVPDLSLA